MEFGVFRDPLPVRPTNHGLLLQMGYCSGLQQSCFHPLQYYRRSYPIPNNQLIHCPWRRGHLCTGNFIPAACLSLPSLSHFFFSLSVLQQWAQTNSLCLFRSSDHIELLQPGSAESTTPIIHAVKKIKSPAVCPFVKLCLHLISPSLVPGEEMLGGNAWI